MGGRSKLEAQDCHASTNCRKQEKARQGEEKQEELKSIVPIFSFSHFLIVFAAKVVKEAACISTAHFTTTSIYTSQNKLNKIADSFSP